VGAVPVTFLVVVEVGAMTTLAWMLLAIVPQEDVMRDRVDLVERNHFYNGDGIKQFEQLIFYDWEPVRGEFKIVTHRVLYPRFNGGHGADWPPDFVGDEYRIYIDMSREVRCKFVRETWTQYDPETLQSYPRKGLRNPWPELWLKDWIKRGKPQTEGRP